MGSLDDSGDASNSQFLLSVATRLPSRALTVSRNLYINLPPSQLQNLIRHQILRIPWSLTALSPQHTMKFKPIHLLWLLVNGPACVLAFPFVQRQRGKNALISTSSIDLAHIVTPVTLTTPHPNSPTATTNIPAGTSDSESQQRGTFSQMSLASVSQTLQTSSDMPRGSQSLGSVPTTTKPSSITPQPFMTPTSETSAEPTIGTGINVHTLTLNVPAIIMEHTVTTTVFIMQAAAEPLTFSATPSGVNQGRHR